MQILRNISEARKFVYGNRVALLALMNPHDRMGKHLIKVLERLEKISKGVIAYAVLSVRTEDEGQPIIALFINGKQVFEQNDYFWHEIKDFQAIKWGIRETLRTWGIEPPF